MHVRRFKMVYIQPSRYDDDGYLYQYRLGLLPSNTMAILYGYTQRLFNSGVFGPDLEVTVEAYDEVVQRVPLSRIIRESRRPDTCLSVGLVGVMSSEFPRAMDLALQFRKAGVPVLMGGIHISGMLKMFETPTGGLKTLIDSGATLIQGEVEDPGALESLLRDVLADTLQPIYRMPDCPDLRNAPVPEADPKYVRRFITRMLTLDTSRGCPFDCSFCCTTYLQGRTIRGRSAPAVLEAIEANHDRGFHNYYFTDDNLARSPIWKELFDGLITLRDRGKSIRFLMMVDTQSWKIPQFVEKAAAAGCYQVFVGMESVNPENLTAVGKKQNRVDEYVEMVSCWRRNGILIHVGYIIGLPHDTLESVRRDIKLLRDKVLIDEASFAMLIPFPGSRDYLNLIRSCVPLDADFNNYDSLHETSRHPNFGPGEWTVAYNDAWSTFYEKNNLIDIFLRVPSPRYWNAFWLLWWKRYALALDVYPVTLGLFRRKSRTGRRPGYPVMGHWEYIWHRIKGLLSHIRIFGTLSIEFQEIWLITRYDGNPNRNKVTELRSRWVNVRRQMIDMADSPNEVSEAALIDIRQL